jgi:ATP-dependent Clp protease ATP-binding subunit ClpA
LFERLSDLARQAIVEAKDEARAHGEFEIDTEYLLLGVTADPISNAVGILHALAVDPLIVRVRIIEIIEATPPGPEPEGHLQFSADFRDALLVSERFISEISHHYRTPAHLLYGLIVADGLARVILHDLGITQQALRLKIIELVPPF